MPDVISIAIWIAELRQKSDEFNPDRHIFTPVNDHLGMVSVIPDPDTDFHFLGKLLLPCWQFLTV